MGRMIVHWSPLHGQCRTTASMGAIAFAMNQISGEKVCLTHTQHGMSDLEGMFDSRMPEERKAMVYQAAGLNALVTNIKRGRIAEEDVRSCSVVTPIKGVELLPGVETKEKVDADDEIDILIFKIITETVKDAYDWAFVDLAAGGGTQSRRFMEAADVVVVTLSQNRAVWRAFFEQHREIAEKGNVFYVIGGHQEDSSYDVKNFSRMFRGKGIRLKAVGCVPNCAGYMDAISDGAVPAFFLMNADAVGKDENAPFMQGCREAARKLKDFAYMQAGGAGKEG